MRTQRLFIASLASAALVLAGCSQGGTNNQETAKPTETQTADEGETTGGTAEKPAPFDQEVRVAVVQQSGQGDYFQQYLNGTKQQAEALGMKLDVYDAQGNNATQATQLDQAIASGVDAIIVRHGQTDTLCPGVNDALAKDIAVIIYDVEIQSCAPDAIQTQQSDAIMASLVLDQMVKDIGTDQKVGYVNVLGIAPLDRRHAVWEEYKKTNNWDELFFTGTYTNSSATDTAPMVVSALQANGDVVAIYAPYDELTKGTLSAIEQVKGAKSDIKVYGADISTADIELMIAENSSWKATGATDPNAIGAAVVRTLALSMAGQLDTKKVEFPPILITQDFLRENNITNMDELRAKEPALNIADTSSADWIPSVKF
ncbi:substrate-binding domain-containing protein [Timonella senegalensis]|uniref:substrate-binding domain-containing protein n=1 Tax=Timonella senegalensis TaxID=1465825 RepID=UPI0028B11247|nr:substrate-binding domain-containing protein [Timonella senegalensis]